jgi:single-stranded-DNA-specific exonuclease
MVIQHKNTKKWSLLYPERTAESEREIASLAQKAGISLMMARLLYLRGHKNVQSVQAFLRQENTSFHDPFLLRDMLLAVARVETALERGERIAIYGDYDVDGVTSVSLLYLYLKARGAKVEYYIPSRTKEGYGISESALDILAGHGVQLMITVDTGITATAEIEYAKGLGIETVVTDHHECRTELPNACAVVNPRRPDDHYPFKELAGVGVVFKLISACEMQFCRRGGEDEQAGLMRICRKYADLVAIGTIADVMPIVDENRLIVTCGLAQIENTKRAGLLALIEAASGNAAKNNKKRKINSSFIGYVIAPRMNAAGRVSNASIAVELLLTEDEERAMDLAARLCDLNLARQVEENRIAEEAYLQIEQTLDAETDRVIVIENDTWQQGIIGIVSSRVTERYGLPSILISFDGAVHGEPSASDIGKGSGRSVKGLNLVEALTACEELLVRFGGHELAAGLSVERANIGEFRRRINQHAREKLGEEPLCMTLDADCEIECNEITMRLAEEIGALEPFGVANPVPVFVLRGARLVRVIPMGGGKHVKLILQKDGVELSAVWFGVSPQRLNIEPTEEVDVMFQLNINEFQNTVSLQLLVQDMRLSEHFEDLYESDRIRYLGIKEGQSFSDASEVIPAREEMGVVYKFLRREYRNGRNSFTMRALLSQLRLQGAEIGYIKLKFMLRVMQELLVCGVSEPDPDFYVFEFYDQTAKTNLDRSSILHKLKKQLRKD